MNALPSVRSLRPAAAVTREICICCGRPLEAAITKLGVAHHADARTVSRNGRTVRLPGFLHKLFEGLMHSYPAVRGFNSSFEDLYGEDFDIIAHDVLHTRLKSYVAMLRRSLKPLGLRIEIIYGLGYRLAAVERAK